jgi:hypothetical protein
VIGFHFHVVSVPARHASSGAKLHGPTAEGGDS